MQLVIEFVAAAATGLGLAILSAMGVDADCSERRVEAVVRKQAVTTLPRPVAASAAVAVHQTIPC